MEGVLLIDKPAGWTSFDAVNYVRKLVATAESKKPKSIKVGHTGTLDPFATGLLVLLVGKNYTRRAGELSKLDKAYDVTLRLGQTSSTGDPEGQITDTAGPQPTAEELEAVLEQFRGPIQQTPPAYSAIKVNGQRAYKLARAGRPVELEPRPVTIHNLELIGYDYPEVRLTAAVSSGTYIRVLAEDIGRALGTGAHTTVLRRTRVGQYSLADAVSPRDANLDKMLKL